MSSRRIALRQANNILSFMIRLNEFELSFDLRIQQTTFMLYLLKRVLVALHDFYTSLLRSKWSNIPNPH